MKNLEWEDSKSIREIEMITSTALLPGAVRSEVRTVLRNGLVLAADAADRSIAFYLLQCSVAT